MLNSFRFYTLSFSALIVIGCASGPSGRTFDTPIGEWSEKYESRSGQTKSTRLIIVDESGGTFTDGRLKFYSVADDRTWKGYWIHETGMSPCSEEKHGSLYWGEQVFHFNETFNQYTGTWDMCGAGPKYTARGYR